jgi:molybdenum ABC transporter molybdate-binding protein
MANISLRSTLTELLQKYQAETSIKVNVRFVPSRDIRLDNPSDSVDIYILANDYTVSTTLDTAPPDPSKKHMMGYLIPCIVVPQFNPALVTSLTDLVKHDVRVGISDPGSDVLGQFAIEILRKNKLYDRLADRLVIAASTQDLAERVAKKELDAAIGWTLFPTWTQGGTDVVLMASTEIPRVAAICARRSQTAVDSAQAIKLMTYLGSDRATDVFRQGGYTIAKTDIEMYATVAQIGGSPE